MLRPAFALIVLARIAHADAPVDPHDTFGFHRKPAEAPLDCTDGKDFGCVTATDPMADTVPYALSTWLPASYLLTLPVADATHDQVADYALGAGRDGAGVNFGGGNGLENRWTIDGAPADNVRTGGVDTQVPLVFLDGIMVTAGGFAARDRTSTGGTIDARLRRGTADHEVEVRAYAGWSAAAAQTPTLPDSYQVRTGTTTPGPTASASIVATGPLGAIFGGKGWYAAGIAPSITRTNFDFRAGTLVDANDDGVPDGAPGLLANQLVEQDHRDITTWSVPAMARVGLDRGPHHVELTLIGSDASAARFIPNATLQAGGVDSTNIIGDGIATYRGEWADTRARVQLAWHRSMHTESAADPKAANIPQVLSAFVPDNLSDDPLLSQKCSDTAATDPYPKLQNCPVPIGWFASGGAGPLVNQTADRPSITADITHRFGANVVRVGATGEDSRLVTTTQFTGGEQQRVLFPGEVADRQFLDPSLPCSEDLSRPCPTSTTSTLTYRTRYTAAYAEDTWHAAPNITVDGGMRWELMWVGPVMHFSDELSPRLGLSWDPLGGGRSRVWMSMGRSFAMLPTGLGATILGRDRTLDTISFEGSTSRSVDTGLPLLVVPGLEPIAQDELTTGAQFAILRAVRLTTWAQGRWLERGLESTPQGFDNPGRFDGLPATRDTAVFAAEISTAPTAQLVIRAGYTYTRAIGSWTGAYDPREGAVLYNSTDFDTTLVNQAGPLPTDIGSRLYIEGTRRGHLGSLAVAVSTRLTLAGGAPRDALGDGDDGIIYLLPRGAAGSSPMQSQANVRLAATWHHFDFMLDLLNLFDHRDATFVEPVYANGSIHPIEGGTLQDLVFLRNDAGGIPTREASYNVPTAFQAPFEAVLGVRRGF